MITPKQKDVLEFLRGYIADKGFAPSLREIMRGLKLSSPSTVHRHLAQLKEKGYISTGEYHSKRATEIIDKITTLPMLGIIAAGEPLEVAEEAKERVDVPAWLQSKEKGSRYVLQVSGDSMQDMGLLDGDYVVIEHREYAENGEVVAALLNGGATLKEYRRTQEGVVLYPKNTKYQPIKVSKDDQFLVRGVLVGSFRQYA